MTQSRTDLVCELAGAAFFGELLPYDLIGETLCLTDPVDRPAIRSAVNRARPRLEREHHRTLVVVPALGYRVAEPSEHLALSRLHVRKARRSMTRGHSKLIHVEASALSSAEQRQIADEQLALAALMAEVDRSRAREQWRRRHSGAQAV